MMASLLPTLRIVVLVVVAVALPSRSGALSRSSTQTSTVVTKSLTPSAPASVTTSRTETISAQWPTRSRSQTWTAATNTAAVSSSHTVTLSSDSTLSATRSPFTVTGVVTLSDVTSTLTATHTRTASASAGTLSAPRLTGTETVTRSSTASNSGTPSFLPFAGRRSLTVSFDATSTRTVTATLSPTPNGGSHTVTRRTPTPTTSQSWRMTTHSMSRSASPSPTATMSASTAATSTKTVTPPPTPSASSSSPASKSYSGTITRSPPSQSASISGAASVWSRSLSLTRTPVVISDSYSNTPTDSVTNSTTPARTPTASHDALTLQMTLTVTQSVSQEINSRSYTQSTDTTVTSTKTLSEYVTGSVRSPSMGTFTQTETGGYSESRTRTLTASQQPFSDGPNASSTSQHMLRLSGAHWADFLTGNASGSTLATAAVLGDLSTSLNIAANQIEIFSVQAGSLIVYFSVTRQAWQAVSDARINQLLLNATTYSDAVRLYRSAGYTDSVVALSAGVMLPMPRPTQACENTCVIVLVSVLAPILTGLFAWYLYRWLQSYRERVKLQRKRETHERRFERRFGSPPPSWFASEPYLPDDGNSIDNETETDTSTTSTTPVSTASVPLRQQTAVGKEGRVSAAPSPSNPIAHAGLPLAFFRDERFEYGDADDAEEMRDMDPQDARHGSSGPFHRKDVEMVDEATFGAPPPTPPLTAHALWALDTTPRATTPRSVMKSHERQVRLKSFLSTPNDPAVGFDVDDDDDVDQLSFEMAVKEGSRPPVGTSGVFGDDSSAHAPPSMPVVKRDAAPAADASSSTSGESIVLHVDDDVVLGLRSHHPPPPTTVAITSSARRQLSASRQPPQPVNIAPVVSSIAQRPTTSADGGYLVSPDDLMQLRQRTEARRMSLMSASTAPYDIVEWTRGVEAAHTDGLHDEHEAVLQDDPPASQAFGLLASPEPSDPIGGVGYIEQLQSAPFPLQLPPVIAATPADAAAPLIHGGGGLRSSTSSSRLQRAARIEAIAAELPEFDSVDDSDMVHVRRDDDDGVAVIEAASEALVIGQRADASSMGGRVARDVIDDEAFVVHVRPSAAAAVPPSLQSEKKKKPSSVFGRIGRGLSKLFSSSSSKNITKPPLPVPAAVVAADETKVHAVLPKHDHAADAKSSSSGVEHISESAPPLFALTTTQPVHPSTQPVEAVEAPMMAVAQRGGTPRKSQRRNRKRPPVGEDDLFAIVTVDGEGVASSDTPTDRRSRREDESGVEHSHGPLSGRTVSFKTD